MGNKQGGDGKKLPPKLDIIEAMDLAERTGCMPLLLFLANEMMNGKVQ